MQRFVKNGLCILALMMLQSVAVVGAGETIGAAPMISVSSLRQELQHRQDWLMVDVRSGAEYEKAHIPGSIRIPIFAVHTKPFLKGKRLLLLSQGFAITPLEKTCQELNEAGFTAFILEGGLNAWHRAGMKLAGDPFAWKTLNRITPRLFYQEHERTDQLVVDISEDLDPEASRFFPGARHFPIWGSDKGVLPKLREELRKASAVRRLVVLTADGRDYEKADQLFQQNGIRNVFYLIGGLRAYEQFLADTALLQIPRERRVLSLSKCQPCED